MNNLHKTTLLIIFSFIYLSLTPASATLIRTTLKKGIFSKKLTYKATSKGGYTGQCLRLELSNTTKDTLMVTIDPGLIFSPQDSMYQPLVTWGSELVTLNSGASQSVDLYAFCGRSSAAAPARNVNYPNFKPGDTMMAQTLRFAKEKNINVDVVQDAVWFFTSRHPLSSVFSSYMPKESEQLVNYMATLLKIPVPKQYLEILAHNDPGKPIFFNSDVKKLFVPMKWNDNANVRHMFVTVFKENGDVYKRIVNSEQIVKDEHTVWVEFNTTNDNPGTYYVELKDNNNKVWDKKKVVVSYNITEFN